MSASDGAATPPLVPSLFHPGALLSVSLNPRVPTTITSLGRCDPSPHFAHQHQSHREAQTPARGHTARAEPSRDVIRAPPALRPVLSGLLPRAGSTHSHLRCSPPRCRASLTPSGGDWTLRGPCPVCVGLPQSDAQPGVELGLTSCCGSCTHRYAGARSREVRCKGGNVSSRRKLARRDLR